MVSFHTICEALDNEFILRLTRRYFYVDSVNNMKYSVEMSNYSVDFKNTTLSGSVKMQLLFLSLLVLYDVCLSNQV